MRFSLKKICLLDFFLVLQCILCTNSISKILTPVPMGNIQLNANANQSSVVPTTTESSSVNQDFTDLLADVMSDIENDLQQYANFVNEK